MRNYIVFFLGMILMLGAANSAFAQDERMFESKDAEYTFQIPNATWKEVPKGSDVRAATEMIYGDRLDGFLQIRKVTLETESPTALSDVIDRETTQKLQFAPGYVAGKEEVFRGGLNGKAFNYEFTQTGKNMTGRIYFLQVDKKNFYVLRFTGLRDKLKLLRVQTDSMARTFKLKETKEKPAVKQL